MSKTYKCGWCKHERATSLGGVCETCRPHYEAWYKDLEVVCRRKARRAKYDARIEAEIKAERARGK
jgi:hypothetical protein